MPIAASDLIYLQAANHAENDVNTQGGAIATAGIIEFTDIAATDNIEVLSDGADTRQITVVFRNAAGAIVSETLTLNGTTPVTTSAQAERLLKATLASADGARTVTVRRATGDTLIATLGPNKTSVRRLFYDAASESAQTIRYEKFFAKNNHGSLQLNAAKLKLTADPAGKLKIGLATAKDDSVSVANRKTAPGGVTFVDDNVDANVPTGALAAGEAIGVWVEMTLDANDNPQKNSFTVQLAGTSV